MQENFENESEVLSAVTQGNKIEAIKYLQESRGIGLKEAKALIDSYMAHQGLTESYQR